MITPIPRPASPSQTVGKTLTFRVAEPQEASLIAGLINTAFRHEVTGQTWLYDDQARRKDIVTPAIITDIITGPNTVFLLCSDTNSPKSSDLPPDNILACCSLRAPASDTPSHMTPGAAWLALLAVDPAIQGRGLGRAMLTRAETYVSEEWQVQRVELDAVNTRTELREWYRRCAYAETGAVRAFEYGATGREVLAVGLEMVVMKKELGRGQA